MLTRPEKKGLTAGQQYGGKKNVAFVLNSMLVCAYWSLSLFRLPSTLGFEWYQCQHVRHLGPVVVISQIPPWGDG